MIRKIAVSLLFFCLLIASFLALAGVENVSIGGPFLGLMQQTSQDLESFKIAIPEVPSIPSLDNVSGFLIVIDALISFFNGLIGILNISIQVFNVIISVIQFIVLIVKNLVTFKDSFILQ